MKKLAIVGIVLSGVLMSAAIAQAKPVGMSKAEYRALMIRSEGLNQKYGVVSTPLPAPAQQSMTERLGEIGAWAVPSHSTMLVGPRDASQQAVIRGKLAEIGAWAVPSKPTASVTSSSDGFDWNNPGLGAAFLLGAVLLGVVSLVTIRRHHRPVAH